MFESREGGRAVERVLWLRVRAYSKNLMFYLIQCTGFMTYKLPDICGQATAQTYYSSESWSTSYVHHYHRVFCPRAGTSLQAQEPRLQFCRRQVFHRKLRNPGCRFPTRDWRDVVASRCFEQSYMHLVLNLGLSFINSLT